MEPSRVHVLRVDGGRITCTVEGSRVRLLIGGAVVVDGDWKVVRGSAALLEHVLRDPEVADLFAALEEACGQ